MTANRKQPDSPGVLKSVKFMFEIVEHLRTHGPVSVTKVAAEFEIPKSTAHSYLKTLQEGGYAWSDKGKYQLSLRFLEYGGYLQHNSHLYQAGKDEVDNLSNEFGERVNLGVEDCGKRVLLYMREDADAIADQTPIGEHSYMHVSALGKAILAYMPEERVKDIISEHGLKSETENTITTEEQLFDELKSIQENGFAIEDEERRWGMRAVAVPIRSKKNPIGSLSISGPKSRFQEDHIERNIINKLQGSANVIELKYEHY